MRGRYSKLSTNLLIWMHYTNHLHQQRAELPAFFSTNCAARQRQQTAINLATAKQSFSQASLVSTQSLIPTSSPNLLHPSNGLLPTRDEKKTIGSNAGDTVFVPGNHIMITYGSQCLTYRLVHCSKKGNFEEEESTRRPPNHTSFRHKARRASAEP